jgi:hypothetical protein
VGDLEGDVVGRIERQPDRPGVETGPVEIEPVLVGLPAGEEGRIEL